jgi:hypothetical protein
VVRPHAFLVVAVLAAAAAGSVALAVLRPRLRWVALLGAALVVSVVVTVVVHDVAPPGAPVIGWPLTWTAALLRFPDWHELTVQDAVPWALGLSLAANGVTTVATAFLGLYATGRRSVGALAAALYATWPVWVALVAGEQAWENGQWHVDVGLHLYTEPLSTALVVGGTALLLRPTIGETRAAAAGLALGYSAVVKLTNGLVAVVLLPLVALRHGVRRALPYGLGCLVSLPIAVAYWPKGYSAIYGDSLAPVDDPWSLAYVETSWRASTIFTTPMLLLLCVPAAVGLGLLRDWVVRLALGLPVLVTAAVYSAYYVTYQHPRFLYVALPFVFVLAATSVVRAVQLAWARGAAAAG